MPVKTKKTRFPLPSKCCYRPIMLVTIYRNARIGMSDKSISEALGFDPATFIQWKKEFPDIVTALEMGRSDTKNNEDWHKFVYDRLSPDIRKLWDRINEWDELPTGLVKIEALLSDHGKSVRQQLFLYSLIQSNFSASRACAKVNIPRSTLNEWIQNDPGFAELVEEIQWHKGNFYEEALVGLVKSGDTGAVIFANRTYNKNRGYAVKNELDIHHSGQIEHTLDLSELELTIEVRQAIMDAIRRREEKIEEEKAKAAIPVEFKVLEDLSDQIAAAAQPVG